MKHPLQINFRLLFFTALILVGAQNIYAYKDPSPKASPVKHSNKALAEGCMPSNAFAFLDINNVRARINAGGDMWWDLNGDAQYFIPQNTFKTAFFAGALWIGGLDDNGNLKVAAQRYRGEGVDFWTGPLSMNGTDSVDAATCNAYDRIWVLYKAEVENFLTAFKLDPTLSHYEVPQYIKDYPAHGDPAKNQSYYLAPFCDVDHNGIYDYTKGDYPYYDFNNALCPSRLPAGVPIATTMEGNGVLADQVLKGDQTLWWIFNDRGNVHAESKGVSIGLEIRAQAFAFATNDEINNMTFYSYEIINRSTNRLNQAWFGQFADVDLGDAWDDYVGCDVKRGLGYVYNGKDPDGTGKPQDYGAQPPAAGIDFFQGPYMDPDGLDNPRFDGSGNLICDVGINGVNFGDGIIDNERFGMNRFMYVSCGGAMPYDCPDYASDYYNLLCGRWSDGEPLRYWGNAHPLSGGVGPVCSFMFPGNSDPCNWGTNGVDPGSFYPGESWTEEQAGNASDDRRFMQSAGPFTMEPGEVNYLTLGVPWARAYTGGPMASVELLRVVDDKAQALFDHCFQIIDGPDAPDLMIQELDRELILYIANRRGISNNYTNRPEDYAEIDPSIVFFDTIPAAARADSAYRFEGYQIYQTRDASVTYADLKNPDKARLAAQCDKKNGITKLVNYYYDENTEGSIPVEEVDGSDAGIVHSFRIFEDMFASGDKRLVNHKQYYYMAIAYAHNDFKHYYPGDPTTYDGQKCPYLSGKKASAGSITVQTGIPHIPSPAAGGTITHSEYGVQPRITRVEGQGNGGLTLDFTQATHDQVLANGWAGNLEYEYNKGPVNIKVIDPLNVIGANYTLKFVPPANGIMDSCGWSLTNEESGEVWTSETAISAGHEQLLMDIGLSIQIQQGAFPGSKYAANLGFLEATIEFSDTTRKWLYGFSDDDSNPLMNWIRSGTLDDPANAANNDFMMSPSLWLDPTEIYEKVLSGTWAPYALASTRENGPAYNVSPFSSKQEMISNTASVDLYLTPDKSKWSRCPVFELCEDSNAVEGGVDKLELRAGSTDGEQGMGWFPGYAINIETGERLNIAFGENSGLQNENGRDMKWNPTGALTSDSGSLLFGGQHWIYIFGHKRDSIYNTFGQIDCPMYDQGQWIKETMQQTSNHNIYKGLVFKDVMWVGAPATIYTGNWDPENIPSEVKIRLRMSKPYSRFYSTKNYGPASPVNNNYPLYTFSTDNIAVTTGSQMAAEGSMELINVVPNPYYAYSGYETSETDHRVKITNLPEQCVITIYSVNGTLIRQYSKNDTRASLDWDLENYEGIPISGGLYLICVKVEGVGEKVLKWFGVMRAGEINSF